VYGRREFEEVYRLVLSCSSVAALYCGGVNETPRRDAFLTRLAPPALKGISVSQLNKQISTCDIFPTSRWRLW
jgi:hypothetical protein